MQCMPDSFLLFLSFFFFFSFFLSLSPSRSQLCWAWKSKHKVQAKSTLTNDQLKQLLWLVVRLHCSPGHLILVAWVELLLLLLPVSVIVNACVCMCVWVSECCLRYVRHVKSLRTVFGQGKQEKKERGGGKERKKESLVHLSQSLQVAIGFTLRSILFSLPVLQGSLVSSVFFSLSFSFLSFVFSSYKTSNISLRTQLFFLALPTLSLSLSLSLS